MKGAFQDKALLTSSTWGSWSPGLQAYILHLTLVSANKYFVQQHTHTCTLCLYTQSGIHKWTRNCHKAQNPQIKSLAKSSNSCTFGSTREHAHRAHFWADRGSLLNSTPNMLIFSFNTSAPFYLVLEDVIFLVTACEQKEQSMRNKPVLKCTLHCTDCSSSLCKLH